MHLGIALEVLRGNWVSSCIEGGISWCFWTYGIKLGIPLDFRRRPQGTFHIASGKSGLLSICEGYLGIPLDSLQGNRASSQVEVENSVFFLSCDKNIGVPIEFQEGSQASSPVRV